MVKHTQTIRRQIDFVGLTLKGLIYYMFYMYNINLFIILIY